MINRSQASSLARQSVRLDQIHHPYGPCPAAIDATALPCELPVRELARQLRERLGATFRAPIDSVALVSGREPVLRAIADDVAGPLVTFPPSAMASRVARAWPDREHLHIVRGSGRHGFLDAEVTADLPSSALALLDSPSDPLGMLLRPVDAVRIARACQMLVVDERYAEFAGQTLLSFAIEFDNVLICRSFASWSGQDETACSWIVASGGLLKRLEDRLPMPSAEAMASALAMLEHRRSIDATMRLVREERSGLYRLLRKFSLFEPLPSWGPFVTARVAIGSRDDIVSGLRERGIFVHVPCQPGLEGYIRFGIGTRASMEHLRTALLDLAPTVLTAESRGRGPDPDRVSLSREELIEAEAGEIE